MLIVNRLKRILVTVTVLRLVRLVNATMTIQMCKTTYNYFNLNKNIINILNSRTIDFSSDFEWENEINDRGELFYVKCSPRKLTKYVKRNTESNDEPKKNKTTAGKLVKLLKRKKQSRDRNEDSKHSGNTNKVTFMDTQV